MVFDYLQSHAEERHFWVDKVQKTAATALEESAAAADLARALWSYFEERSAVASPFRELARREGLRRTSMRNLAEYLLRLWVVPRPKPRPQSSPNQQ